MVHVSRCPVGSSWLPAGVFRQDFFCADGDRREDEK